ncbi:hypothetical protein [Streptomyces sp. NPDC046712]|uniref:hypothetical protein n=1 Tax=Streptomyces sp. NPDC046712 TaxID=3154802 RepID=UPI0033FDC3E8
MRREADDPAAPRRLRRGLRHRGAATIAEAELRTRRARPYLQQVAEALNEAGVAESVQVEVRQLDGDHLMIAIPLTANQTSPALVGDERADLR